MSNLKGTDHFYVERDYVKYKVSPTNLMSNIKDDDLLIVNRGGIDYKITGSEVKASVDTNSPPVGEIATGTLSIESPFPGETIGRTAWYIQWAIPSGVSGSDGSLTIFDSSDASVAFSTSVATSDTSYTVPGDLDFGAFKSFVIQIVYPGSVTGVSFAGSIVVQTNNNSSFRLPAGDSYTEASDYVPVSNTTATDISLAVFVGSRGDNAGGFTKCQAYSSNPGNCNQDAPRDGGDGGDCTIKYITMPITYAQTTYPGSREQSIRVPFDIDDPMWDDATYAQTITVSGGIGGWGRESRDDPNKSGQVGGNQSGTTINDLRSALPIYTFSGGSRGSGGGKGADNEYGGNGGGGGAAGVNIGLDPLFPETPSIKSFVTAQQGGNGGDAPTDSRRKGGTRGQPGTGAGAGGGGGGGGAISNATPGSNGGGGVGAGMIVLLSEVVESSAYLAITPYTP